jgi:hypothetical protein
LICRVDADSGERSWIEVFQEALAVFRTGEFGKARVLMNRTRKMRGRFDGPAKFYLSKMEMVEAKGFPERSGGGGELSKK